MLAYFKRTDVDSIGKLSIIGGYQGTISSKITNAHNRRLLQPTPSSSIPVYPAANSVPIKSVWDSEHSSPTRQHKNSTITEGPEAFKLYLQAFHIHAEPNKKPYIDSICVTDIEHLDNVLLGQIRKISKAYEENTLESITRACKIELPALDQIMIDFSMTDCGRQIFSAEAQHQMRMASRILRSANLTIEQQDLFDHLWTKVLVNGEDIGGNLHLMGSHLATIDRAQSEGTFTNMVKPYHDNEWHQVGLMHGMLHKFLVIVVKDGSTNQDGNREDDASAHWIVALILGLTGTVLIGATVACSHLRGTRKNATTYSDRDTKNTMLAEEAGSTQVAAATNP